MGRDSGCCGFHHIGTFLLLAASALLIATSVTAPVVPDLGFLKVTLTNRSSLRNSSVVFGVLGHCVLDVAPASTDQDLCSGRSIGYSIGSIIVNTTGISNYSTSARDAATKGLVLVPVAAGISFISFLIAAVSHRIGFLTSAFFCGIAFLVALAALVVQCFIFVSVKYHVNHDGSGALAAYAYGFWFIIASVVALFFAFFATLLSCITDRKKRY